MNCFLGQHVLEINLLEWVVWEIAIGVVGTL